MSLVNIVSNLSEFLESPLGHIDKGLDLLSCLGVESANCFLEFILELTVVSRHEAQDIDNFP